MHVILLKAEVGNFCLGDGNWEFIDFGLDD